MHPYVRHLSVFISIHRSFGSSARIIYTYMYAHLSVRPSVCRTVDPYVRPYVNQPAFDFFWLMFEAGLPCFMLEVRLLK